MITRPSPTYGATSDAFLFISPSEISCPSNIDIVFESSSSIPIVTLPPANAVSLSASMSSA